MAENCGVWDKGRVFAQFHHPAGDAPTMRSTYMCAIAHFISCRYMGFRPNQSLGGVMQRSGGRSLRIKNAVFGAIAHLLNDVSPSQLTVPDIARVTGVAASTIYRRWGKNEDLLAEYALETLIGAILATANLGERLTVEALAQTYAQHVCSPLGRYLVQSLFVDVLLGEDVQGASSPWFRLRSVIASVLEGDQSIEGVGDIFDFVIAPLTCRAMRGEPVTSSTIDGVVARLPRSISLNTVLAD